MNELYVIGIFLFVVQLLLCFKAEKMAIKLIPVYLLLFLLLFAIVLLIFGTDGFGTRLLGFLFFMGTLGALVVDGLSWLVYLTIIKK